MTAIKQRSVCSRQHLASIKRYLDWDRDKALAHDTLNIADEGRWFEEMDGTREAYGHNPPARRALAARTCSTRSSPSTQTSATSTAAR